MRNRKLDDFVLTQRKEVVMTSEKTTVTLTEKLESVDVFGRRTLIKSSRSESTAFHNDVGRVA
ncbi:MAG: hypothetical protein KIG65_00960 [Eubacteriales bacterium]|nr:hypothetical protein [Eubacteriales bacterium]